MIRHTLLVVFVAMLGCSCVAAGRLTSQHEPTAISTLPPPVDPQSPGYRQSLPFSEYVAWATAQTRRARGHAGLGGPHEDAILDMRAPFEWPPEPGRCAAASTSGRRRGILLIHGLTDSPFLMRDLGRHFQKTCFLVRAILLPGHGTVPGDLLTVRYQDWIEASRYGIESFAGQVDDLYVAGFSTGGALAVYHALEPHGFQRPITALLLFSPAIKVASRLVPLANWHKIYSWAIPQGQWDDRLFAERDGAKYESFAKNAGDQVYLLTEEVEKRRRQRPFHVPIFVALSRDDSTVSSPATIAFFNAVTPADGSSKNVLLNYTRAPYALGDERPLRDRSSVYPGEGIISFAHVALPVRPDNPHYGRDGSYRSCLAYEKPNDERAAEAPDSQLVRCRRGRPPEDGVRLGEISLREDLEAASALERLNPPLVLRRLTFNPDFDGMMAEIDAFIERVQAGAR